MSNNYYVYVYRDADGNPVYFGQGKGSVRPGSHTAATHNAALQSWLRTASGYRIEVLGPLGSKPMADAVETALISACKPAARLALFNDAMGPSPYRFRPYGVPEEYADRATSPLSQAALFQIAREVGPLMFVRITKMDLDGERKGYDLAAPPKDSQLRSRVEAWWKVKRFLAGWAADPESSPALLLGVTGVPGSQLIVASAMLDRAAWSRAETKRGGLVKLPLLSGDLDARALRGRTLDREVIAFDRFNSCRIRAQEDLA